MPIQIFQAYVDYRTSMFSREDLSSQTLDLLREFHMECRAWKISPFVVEWIYAHETVQSR
jgi:hypothetical protein